ncbi:pleurocidin-like peptide WF3 [Neolamprologus brichardi]|uniref:pleurocidin-like peptide WF3 n=1 Tax=Neolamprologus brichardi TaxID=32507 RepID=UPI0003EBC044|nr:pleurocidin-like peptide WF3 [Neolamprologus brichardi]
MKCTVVFLVLSMVILMAEPGECIWDAVFHGAKHFLHRLVNGPGVKDAVKDVQQKQEQQKDQELDKRAISYHPRRLNFD